MCIDCKVFYIIFINDIDWYVVFIGEMGCKLRESFKSYLNKFVCCYNIFRWSCK